MKDKDEELMDLLVNREKDICSHDIVTDGNIKRNRVTTIDEDTGIELEDDEKICPDCEGGCFNMVCYGGNPTERDCERCDGEGKVEK